LPNCKIAWQHLLAPAVITGNELAGLLYNCGQGDALVGIISSCLSMYGYFARFTAPSSRANISTKQIKPAKNRLEAFR